MCLCVALHGLPHIAFNVISVDVELIIVYDYDFEKELDVISGKEKEKTCRTWRKWNGKSQRIRWLNAKRENTLS